MTLPQARTALAGGALLVGLYLLGEYGAFAMLRYTTFATASYTSYQTGFDATSAGVLTLVLVAGLAHRGGHHEPAAAARPPRARGHPPNAAAALSRSADGKRPRWPS